MEAYIRPMTGKDIDAVKKIEDYVFSHPWDKKSFVSDVVCNQFAYYYVACLGEQIIGYGGMWVINKEAHLSTLAVHYEYQLMGVARQLLNTLVEKAWMMGAAMMTLEVRPGNDPAIKLYTGAGFEAVSIRKEYYPDGDAMVMMNNNLEELIAGHKA